MFESGTHAFRPRSRRALLLAIVLLPGWVLPPECAACPHGTADDALHVESAGMVVEGEHAGVHAEIAPTPEHHEDHRAEQADDAEDGSHDCGCPCDLECAAPDFQTPRATESRASVEGDAPLPTIAATALRPEEPRFPSFFLPLSNAPPR